MNKSGKIVVGLIIFILIGSNLFMYDRIGKLKHQNSEYKFKREQADSNLIKISEYIKLQNTIIKNQNQTLEDSLKELAKLRNISYESYDTLYKDSFVTANESWSTILSTMSTRRLIK